MDTDGLSNDTDLDIDFTQDPLGNGIPMDPPPTTRPSDWNRPSYKSYLFDQTEESYQNYAMVSKLLKSG
jgi:hypothetical protein